jgi:uncharacterized membrane protein
MSDQPVDSAASGEVTQDDKLWAMLAYVVPAIVALVLLFWAEKKSRPFIRSHTAQALALGVLFLVSTALITGVVGCCTTPVIYIYMVYCGIQAYGGKTVTVPVLTDFIKNQGWA